LLLSLRGIGHLATTMPLTLMLALLAWRQTAALRGANTPALLITPLGRAALHLALYAITVSAWLVTG